MITIVAALAENNCIGKDGKLPWRIPEDQKRYRELTMGTVVVMGRKTWESLPEKFRPLPNRKNVVITRQADYPVPEGVEIFASLELALAAHKDEPVTINGGSEIYRQGLAFADKLELTRVHRVVEGDTFFPEIDPAEWKETQREDHDGFSFLTYERIR